MEPAPVQLEYVPAAHAVHAVAPVETRQGMGPKKANTFAILSLAPPQGGESPTRRGRRAMVTLSMRPESKLLATPAELSQTLALKAIKPRGTELPSVSTDFGVHPFQCMKRECAHGRSLAAKHRPVAEL